ncbi:unnamed protein product, partial [Callosobruchus maculatus]
MFVYQTVCIKFKSRATLKVPKHYTIFSSGI